MCFQYSYRGTDTDSDPQPRIIAALFGGRAALPSATGGPGVGDAEAMLAAFDAYADRLGPDQFGH